MATRWRQRPHSASNRRAAPTSTGHVARNPVHSRDEYSRQRPRSASAAAKVHKVSTNDKGDNGYPIMYRVYSRSNNHSGKSAQSGGQQYGTKRVPYGGVPHSGGGVVGKGHVRPQHGASRHMSEGTKTTVEGTQSSSQPQNESSETLDKQRADREAARRGTPHPPHAAPPPRQAPHPWNTQAAAASSRQEIRPGGIVLLGQTNSGESGEKKAPRPSSAGPSYSRPTASNTSALQRRLDNARGYAQIVQNERPARPSSANAASSRAPEVASSGQQKQKHVGQREAYNGSGSNTYGATTPNWQQHQQQQQYTASSTRQRPSSAGASRSNLGGANPYMGKHGAADYGKPRPVHASNHRYDAAVAGGGIPQRPLSASAAHARLPQTTAIPVSSSSGAVLAVNSRASPAVAAALAARQQAAAAAERGGPPRPTSAPPTSKPATAAAGAGPGAGGAEDQAAAAAAERERLERLLSSSKPKERSTTDFYSFGDIVGSGSFAKVRVARHKLTGMKVAIKTYEKNKIKDASALKRIQSEIRLMERLDHPLISRFFEAIESQKRIHLVMEFLGEGNLCTYIKNKKKLSEDEARIIFSQLAQGLDYMHSNHVIHRDIKLENVLFDAKRNAKLIDFGFSVQCKDPKTLKVFCGTPSYMAPEIVRRAEYRGKPVDLWSMGVVLFAMLSGCFPFSAKTYPELYKKILRGTFRMPETFSPGVQDLLTGLLSMDPNRRLTVKQARQHPWVRMYESPPLRHTSVAAFTVSKDAREDLYREAIGRMTGLGVDEQLLIADVTTKRRNSLTTCYYLLAAAMRLRNKAGGLGVS